MSETRINKSELEAIGRALRANVKAAKATIVALGPKLKAEFEVQLATSYPASGDPVWKDALAKVYACYAEQQARVEVRCEELRIPERFRPHLIPRPMSIEWARNIRDQCQTDAVAFFCKQLGGYPDKRHALQLFPHDLQIRQMPIAN